MTQGTPQPDRPQQDDDGIIKMDGPPPRVIFGKQPTHQNNDGQRKTIGRCATPIEKGQPPGRVVTLRPPDSRDGPIEKDKVGTNITKIRRETKQVIDESPTQRTIIIPQDWGQVTIQSDVPGLDKRLNPSSQKFQDFQKSIGGLIFYTAETNEIIIQRDALAYRNADEAKQTQMRDRLQTFINSFSEKFKDNKVEVKVRKMHDHSEDFDSAVGF